MGLFKHKKEKEARPDLLNPPTGGDQASQNPSPTPNQNGNAEGAQNNSFNDSTYYSSSDLSSGEAQKASLNQKDEVKGKPPGTTVTTTTTTTTSKSF